MERQHKLFIAKNKARERFERKALELRAEREALQLKLQYCDGLLRQDEAEFDDLMHLPDNVLANFLVTDSFSHIGAVTGGLQPSITRQTRVVSPAAYVYESA